MKRPFKIAAIAIGLVSFRPLLSLWRSSPS